MNCSKLEEKIYPLLREKQLEVAYVPPQRLGALTFIYHRLTPWFKEAPWRIIAVWAILVTIVIRLLLGSSFVVLASILQRAF